MFKFRTQLQKKNRVGKKGYEETKATEQLAEKQVPEAETLKNK